MVRKLIQKIEKWLADLVYRELIKTEHYIAEMFEKYLKEIDAQTKAAIAEIEKHAEQTAAKLRDDLSLDAKTIAEFRRSTRMSCSHCGRYGWSYTVNKDAGTVTCATCAAKGK